jgi:hypothetical protein
MSGNRFAVASPNNQRHQFEFAQRDLQKRQMHFQVVFALVRGIQRRYQRQRADPRERLFLQGNGAQRRLENRFSASSVGQRPGITPPQRGHVPWEVILYSWIK